jgi:hypothetical protein
MMLLGVPVILLSLIQLASCGPGKYTPKPNEEIYGTWTNEKMSPQKEIHTADGSKQYLYTSDSTSFYEGTGKTISKWTDSEGNIWYKVLSTFTTPNTYKGQIFTVLEKLSKSATVWESVWASPSSDAELKNPVYPAAIDPNNSNYRIYYRTEK